MWNTLINKIFRNPLIAKFVGSLVRHGMTALAGALVAMGIPEAAEVVTEATPAVVEMVVAIILGLMAVGWSFKAKTKEK